VIGAATALHSHNGWLQTGNGSSAGSWLIAKGSTSWIMALGQVIASMNNTASPLHNANPEPAKEVAKNRPAFGVNGAEANIARGRS